MATTLRQPTASTTTKDRGSFLLLAGLVGFIFAFRICLTVLWFQDAPESASLLSGSPDQRTREHFLLHPKALAFPFSCAALLAGNLARKNTAWVWPTLFL